MNIHYIENGFVQTFCNYVVERVICYYDGTCEVHFHDRSYKVMRIGCSSYNSQYGTPISDDGKTLYIGSWEKGMGGLEKGLTAFDIDNGAVLWRLNEGKIRNIFVFHNYLIVFKAYAALLKVDPVSGVVINQLRSTAMERVIDLSCPYVYVDTISGSHCVVDTEQMKISKKYNMKTVNPSNCLSFVVQSASLHNGVLEISGFEEFPCKDYSLKGQTPFNRVIDSSFQL